MPESARIVLSGEINSDLKVELAEIADEAVALGVPIQIDAHHVSYLGATGIAFLTDLAGRLPVKPDLLHTPPTVSFLLEATHTRELFSFN